MISWQGMYKGFAILIINIQFMVIVIHLFKK